MADSGSCKGSNKTEPQEIPFREKTWDAVDPDHSTSVILCPCIDGFKVLRL